MRGTPQMGVFQQSVKGCYGTFGIRGGGGESEAASLDYLYFQDLSCPLSDLYPFIDSVPDDPGNHLF